MSLCFRTAVYMSLFFLHHSITIIATTKQCPSWPSGWEVMTTSSSWVVGYISSPSPTVRETYRITYKTKKKVNCHLMVNDCAQKTLNNYSFFFTSEFAKLNHLTALKKSNTNTVYGVKYGIYTVSNTKYKYQYGKNKIKYQYGITIIG